MNKIQERKLYMNIKKIYDVSLVLKKNIATYPGDPQYDIDEYSSIKKGSVANNSHIKMGVHTGTHVDAPKHFIDNGTTIDNLPLDYLLGEAKVFEISGEKVITKALIEKLDIQKNDIVIFKTDNSDILQDTVFHTEYTYFDFSAAEYLKNIGIKTVGCDYLSIEQFKTSRHVAHETLLGANIVIIEGLLLKGIKPGKYFLSALPLKIQNGNGSPVRAILMEI
jgi:arylformamidase